MPTPSKAPHAGEWTARTDVPKRSVFKNYSGAAGSSSEAQAAPGRPGASPHATAPLQGSIDLAVARAFIHRYLAKAYEDPTEDGWRWLCDPGIRESLRSAWALAVPAQGAQTLPLAAAAPGEFSSFLNAYLAAFGHAARGACPLNEIEYGDVKADPLFQAHRLADLAAFYRAFGLELSADAGERHDHLCLQLEFMCVLAAKEAYALEYQLDSEQLAQCRDAEKKFLREHLGRWTPAFGRRLAAATDEPALHSLAEATGAFIMAECARFGVQAGSEDLLLRPVDEAADSLCNSCGLNNLPPGAAHGSLVS